MDDSAPNQTSPAFVPPAWAVEMMEQHRADTTRCFVLHGNVHDLMDQGNGQEFGSLSRFLATWMFARYDVVLKFDLSGGLDVYTGPDGERRRRMIQRLEAVWGDFKTWPREPETVLKYIDRLVTRVMLDEGPAADMSLAVIFEYAQYLTPSADLIRGGGPQAANLVQMLAWASNPYIKQEKMAFCLIADPITELNERLVASAHVASLALPMPGKAERKAFIRWCCNSYKMQSTDDEIDTLAELTSGLNLVSLERLLARARQAGRTLEAQQLKQIKKSLIERQLQGLIEFVEPGHTLERFVGNTAVRQRLEDDARLIVQGHLAAAPMGYLICGPVGTGKTFLAECFAGSVGIPCVKLRNFRSKYVGETEGNLERILTVLRAMGPVVVVIDEADAALGTRAAEGDSGTSSRVFSMLASQMGDTQFRGRLIWMLMTSRPELLPIDLKRQGRAEVHLPLFAPQTDEETRAMIVSMAKKNKVPLETTALPEGLAERGLSGADIESVVLSARRLALVAGHDQVTADDFRRALADFIPAAEGAAKERQEICAVLECTSTSFLPEKWRDVAAQPEGRARLQQRAAELGRAMGRD